MKKKKIVAYVRTRQDEGLSVHKEYFKRLFANREDCELIDFYWDSGRSGFDRYRYAFKQMIADAENGKYDYVVVKSLAKLSRDTDAAIKTIKKLKDHGVGVYSITEQFDSLSNKCEEYIGIMEAIAELRKQITEKERRMAALMTKKTED